MDKNQKSKFPKDMSKCILKGHDAFATERGWTRFNLYIQGKKKKKKPRLSSELSFILDS